MRTLLLAALTLALTQHLAAQPASYPPPGTRVRVFYNCDRTCEQAIGVIAEWTAESMVVTADDASRVEIPRATLEGIDTSRGRKRYTVAGLLGGLSVGLTLGFYIGYAVDPSEDDFVSDLGGAGIGALIGLVAGGFIGSAVGGSFTGSERWVRVPADRLAARVLVLPRKRMGVSATIRF